jgi:hypothetical protein
MSPFLREVLHVVQIVLTFIGGSAVLGFFGWLFKRRQENFEDKVLSMFASDPQRQLRTANGIHNDYRREHLKDVPVWVMMPDVHTSWWAGVKWRIRTIPYQARHVWRMKFFMPSLKKVEKTVLRLWKRGLLIRDQAKPQYYKLRS